MARRSSRTFGPQVTLGSHESSKPLPPEQELAETEEGTKEIIPVPEGETGRSIADYIPADITVNGVQKDGLMVMSRKLSKGPATAGSMICQAHNCPFIGFCELNENGIPLPVGDKCPIEEFVADEWRDHFLSDLNIRDEDRAAFARRIVENMVARLVLEMRVMRKGGLEPDPVPEVSVGTNFLGETITTMKLWPGLDYLVRSHAAGLRELRELLGTPRAKAEAGRLGYDDPSSKTSEAQAEAQKRLSELAATAGQDGQQALPGPTQYLKLDLNDFGKKDEGASGEEG